MNAVASMPMPLSMIRLKDRTRTPRESRIAAVVEELKQSGQPRTPLLIAPEARAQQSYLLVTGAVTYLAMKRLGWETTPVRIRRLSQHERKWAELDDNLLQDGTTVLERAQMLAAAKELYEIDHPEAAHGGDRRSQARQDQTAGTATWSPGFAAYAATRYGRAERTIRTHASIGATIDADAAQALAESDFADKVSELTALSRLEPGLQLQVAELLTRDVDAASSVADALSVLGDHVDQQPDLFDRFHNRLLSAWAGFGAREKRMALQALAQLDLPKGVRIVFDGDSDE